MPFAAALSEHPLATHAVGEVVGQVLEELGEEPDLAVLFATAPHVGALEDIVGAVRAVLRPGRLLGASAVSVLGGAREVEETAAVSLWAARLGDRPAPPRPVRLTVTRESELDLEGRLLGLPDDVGDARSLLLLADPFSFPTTGVLDAVRVAHPDLQVVGGLASAARGPGGNRLVLDGTLHHDGAVGVLLDQEVAPRAVVSQGCRPIGEPFTVTRAERNVLYELGGRPALDRLMEILDGLPAEDRALAARGLFCGIVVDETKLEYERGDFLVRGVLGGDREAGAVAVGDVVEVGATVQFQVRDAVAADEDLRAVLEGATGDAALVFTCNGRGTPMFGVPDHDAEVISDALGTAAVSGMFCAGELGPVGGRSFLHTFTASVAVFRDRPGGRPTTAR